MLLDRLFRPRPAQTAGRTLYSEVVSQARQPMLYESLGCPDTAEGRFEVYTLHVLLVLNRLREIGHGSAAINQASLTKTVA